MKLFAGGTAVVTGAAGVLGRTLTDAFAQASMNIVLADLDAPGLEARLAALEAAPGQILSITTDVTKAADMDALAETAYQRFGAVNLLCLNAGLSIRKPFAELERNDWKHVLDVQFHGVLNGVLSFLPHLIKQSGSRHILITASMSGVGRADLRILNAPYVVAKHAVVGLAEVMKPAVKGKRRRRLCLVPWYDRVRSGRGV